LTLLYGFNPAQARRSFLRAAAEDPSLAIAWWGVAMSDGLNINSAFDPEGQRAGHAAIGKAQSLAKNATPAERALIAAAAKRFAYDRARDAGLSATAYRDAMNAAALAFPDDDDVQVLAVEAEMDVHPWSYFNDDGTPTPGTESAIARDETVLARDPAHIGANHFAIHLFEESKHPEDALPSADRLFADSFEPAAEHLAHMPAHTFMRVGRYDDAGLANARAIALYAIYLAGSPAEQGEYLEHDCTFGVIAFMMAGVSEDAERLAMTCAHSGFDSTKLVAIRFRHWDALASAGTLSPFLGGMLAVHQGRIAAAREDLVKLDLTGTIGRIESGLLSGAIERAKGDADGEIAALEHAVAAQDTFGYSEPPLFFFPVRESLGAAFFRAGRYPEAERTFLADLERNRENPRSLYGLRETLLREGRTRDAAAADARFATAWRKADVQLSMNDL
jgi:tetratricopeptide (TPR) repeat protein